MLKHIPVIIKTVKALLLLAKVKFHKQIFTETESSTMMYCYIIHTQTAAMFATVEDHNKHIKCA